MHTIPSLSTLAVFALIIGNLKSRICFRLMENDFVTTFRIWKLDWGLMELKVEKNSILVLYAKPTRIVSYGFGWFIILQKNKFSIFRLSLVQIALNHTLPFPSHYTKLMFKYRLLVIAANAMKNHWLLHLSLLFIPLIFTSVVKSSKCIKQL